MTESLGTAIATPEVSEITYSPVAAAIAQIKMQDIPDGRKRALIKAVLQRQIVAGKRGGGRH
ncbi:hypothetical protein [Scytonema sp. NUACC26]|uniref:hypothetical protein n=1 Tax=Scytonema sp. NUACC26 TaxID=3140176 RepID=UPI0034DC0A71